MHVTLNTNIKVVYDSKFQKQCESTETTKSSCQSRLSNNLLQSVQWYYFHYCFSSLDILSWTIMQKLLQYFEGQITCTIKTNITKVLSNIVIRAGRAPPSSS